MERIPCNERSPRHRVDRLCPFGRLCPADQSRVEPAPHRVTPSFCAHRAALETELRAPGLSALGLALGAAGLLAYSGADEAIENWHRTRVRGSLSDRLSHLFKYEGERFWFGNWALVAALDAWVRSNWFSRWGRANFEAMVVGLPTLWTLQRGLGANRPSSDDGSPRWRPMKAANSASGHAFLAAVPWLTLARRNQLVPVQWAARLGSVLTGWSRLNDRKHYVSQIILGWTIAWNAVWAVEPNEAPGCPRRKRKAHHERTSG